MKKINELNENVILLDIGKGMFDKNTLNALIKNNFKVFRLDVSTSLDMEVENSEIFKILERKNYIKIKVGNYILASSGLLGQNDLIVDNAKKLKQFWSLHGKGDFISVSKQKNNITNNLYKILRRK